MLETLLEFAVHDLGARAASAPSSSTGPTRRRAGDFELRLPAPPALDVRQPTDLAPLRHALAQTDGAAVFDGDGILRQLGVRLVPSPEAEAEVEGFRGMRHTSGRRYSYDDPAATVIVVSEDGPVTVLRSGEILGTSPCHAAISPGRLRVERPGSPRKRSLAALMAAFARNSLARLRLGR